MIKGKFGLGNELIEVIVKNNNILFYDVLSQKTTTIEGLKISKAGVLLEFPELKKDPEWKRKSIENLKKQKKRINTH